MLLFLIKCTLPQRLLVHAMPRIALSQGTRLAEQKFPRQQWPNRTVG